MQRFIEPIVTNQADVVLNKIDKLIEIGKCPNMDIVWRKMLNEILRRPDLKAIQYFHCHMRLRRKWWNISALII